MMQELDIKSFKDLQDQNKFIEAFLVEGGRDVDFNLLQACLNVYMPAENVNDNPQSVITRTLLSKFGQNPDRVIDFLDIDNNGSIHRAELFDGARKIVHNYERVNLT
jgi:hypothetical protein